MEPQEAFALLAAGLHYQALLDDTPREHTEPAQPTPVTTATASLERRRTAILDECGKPVPAVVGPNPKLSVKPQQIFR